MKNKWLRWFLRALGVFVVLVLLAALGNCTSQPTIPESVTRTKHTLQLSKDRVTADVYLPKGVETAPVVMVVHGFSRSRNNMSGWGVLLAQQGFIVVVPTMPKLSANLRNGRAMRELLDEVMAGKLFTAPHPQPHNAALVGFSMGGCVTLLAAEKNPHVAAWVGLDPVDFSGLGEKVIKDLAVPSLIVRAEPAPFNLNGNSRHLITAAHGPMTAMCVKDSTHCDAENPSSPLANLACGEVSAHRLKTYEKYVTAILRKILVKDPTADEILTSAATDTRLKDVVLPSP
ncbi:MAG: dienelactone hydrolase family protein [Verrucomicrobiaceae bacterium]|nr:dienelactone hydrolase family protein [Verrucomicrobiaceae bacterium]